MKLTRSDVRERLHGLTPELRRRVICALVGHSQIVDVCFGQVTCHRCDAVVGDTFMCGGYDLKSAVVVGHKCGTCITNLKKMKWHDKLETPKAL